MIPDYPLTRLRKNAPLDYFLDHLMDGRLHYVVAMKTLSEMIPPPEAL
jgi:hypothetical protein